MSFDFNPRPKNDKGVGQIDLDKENEAAAKQDGGSRKWIIGGIAGAALLGIAGVFALVAGNDNEQPAPTIPQTEHTAPAPRVEITPPQIQVERPATPTVSEIRAQSIAQKQGAIYRDDARAYFDHRGTRGEAYINSAGQMVSAGQDFAVHVTLFNRGGVSVLVASGPYAGSRVSFFPVMPGGQSVITYEKVGAETLGADGRTTVFQLLPQGQRVANSVSMKTPAIQGSGVSMPDYTRAIEKLVSENGELVPAFLLRGSPEVDGLFSVSIWNGDTYNFNLKNGEYSIDSVFAFVPNYIEQNIEVDRNQIQVIHGVLEVAPAMRPAGPAFRP